MTALDADLTGHVLEIGGLPVRYYDSGPAGLA
jgi:hypothetical protein